MVQAKCAGCGRSFEAKTRRAKWCKPACKMRAARRGATGPARGKKKPQADEAPATSGGGLVATIHKELEAAGRLDTVNGQLALQLAKLITEPGATGVATLAKQLPVVMNAALADGEDRGGEKPADSELDDEVAKAREARERKAREASGRA